MAMIDVRHVDDLRWWCKDCEVPTQLLLAATLPEAQKYARQHTEATGHRTVAHMLMEDYFTTPVNAKASA